jgi:rSAM/selenodomain-associated transferase 1
MSSAVIIFIRSPLQGKVKTRLAKTLGEEKAAGFYRLCIEAIIHEISQLSREVDRYVFFTEPIFGYKTEQLLGSGFKIEVQEGESLGQRLCHAISSVFESGAQKAIAVASDVPDLTYDIIEKALNSLDKSDIVIGPCYDGGYYLIGMKRLYQELFKDISWGTELVIQQTLAKIKDYRLTLEQLPVLIDIDTEEDLRRWIERKGRQRPEILDFLTHMNI